MANYKKEDFEYTEAEILSAECLSCGWFEDTDSEVAECPECDNEEVIHDTSFEGCECVECKLLFEPYDNAYTHVSNFEPFMCEHCYDKLED